MTTPAREDSFLTICDWFDTLVGGEHVPAPSLAGLDELALIAAEKLCQSIERAGTDWLVASLQATQARQLCEQANWPEAAALARCAAQLPALMVVEEIDRQRRRGQPRISTVDRLTAMLEQARARRETQSRDTPSTSDPLPSVLSGMQRAFESDNFEWIKRDLEWLHRQEADLSQQSYQAAKLDALLLMARELGLKQSFQRGLRPLLNLLADLAGNAYKGQEWETLARCRALYLYWLYQSEPSRAAYTPYYDESPDPFYKSIGVTVGKCHAINFVHGTLLLENFGGRGEVRNFGSSRIIGAEDISEGIDEVLKQPEANIAGWMAAEAERLQASIELQRGKGILDREALVEDLISLRYQLTVSQWNTFSEGYLDELPEGSQILAEVVRRVPDTVLGREADCFPFVSFQLEHFAIGVSTYALWRVPEAAQIVQQTIEEALASDDIDRLIEAVLLAKDIFPEAQSNALQQVLRLVFATIREQQFAEAEAICRHVLDTLANMLRPDQKGTLSGIADYAQAQLTEDNDESGSLLLKAANTFLDQQDAGSEQFAYDMLNMAIQRVTDPLLGSEIAATLLPLIINQAMQKNDRKLLSAAAKLPSALGEMEEPHKPAIIAYARYAEGLGTDDPAVQRRIFQEVREMVRDLPKMQGMYRRLSMMLGGTDDTSEAFVPSLEARSLMHNEQWVAARNRLQAELEDCEREHPDSEDCLQIVPYLASALHMCMDFVPHERRELAKTHQSLLQRYAPRILEAPESEDDLINDRRASIANALGWTAIQLSDFLNTTPEQIAMLDMGTRLLELAVGLSSRDRDNNPSAYSAHANNLAMAYKDQAAKQDLEVFKAMMAKSTALMESVIEIDEQLLHIDTPEAQAVARTRDIDYLNLGVLYEGLAARTYDSKWISRKPLDSAHAYRHAIDAFDQSARIAQENGNWAIMGTAQTMLAKVYITFCEHYILERQWAGGDLERAFYDWMCTVAGRQVNTTSFVHICTENALLNVASALEIGFEKNPGLLLESVQALLLLWSLVHRREAIPVDVIRQTLLLLLKTVDTMERRGSIERYANELHGIRELRDIVTALVSVQVYETVTYAADELERAHAIFLKLSRTGSPIGRAMARPYLGWQDLQTSPDGVVVNGLFIGALNGGERGRAGLEFRLTALRRNFHFWDIEILKIDTISYDSNLIKEEAAMALVALEPALHWQELPPSILVNKLVGTANGTLLSLETLRLPVSSWNTWLLMVKIELHREVPIPLSFPFVGVYDLATRQIDTAFPAHLTRSSQVLIFGEEGLTLEVALPPGEVHLDGANDRGDLAALRVEGTRQDPILYLSSPRAVMVLKATPQLALADVCFFAKDDGTPSPLCCAASSSLATPSYSLPVSALHHFAPLFFFSEEVEPSALDLINELNPREMVIVGIPDSPAAADRLLDQLFEPGRELFILVQDSEVPGVEAALARLNGRIRAHVGGATLMITAASATATVDPFRDIQVINVSRVWSAAAVQMLLDMASLRHREVQGTPVIHDGNIVTLNIKGNPLGQSKDATLFAGTTTWDVLKQRYLSLVKADRAPMLVAKGFDPKLASLITLAVPERPLFILPSEQAAMLAAIPYIRHLGALPIPATGELSGFFTMFQPSIVYAGESTAIPDGSWTIHRYPEHPHMLAQHLQAVVNNDFANTIDGLGDNYPHLLSSRELLEEMRPGEYLVLSVYGENQWAYVAANYAAALHAPLLLLDIDPSRTAEIAGEGLMFLSGSVWMTRSETGEKQTRDAIRRQRRELSQSVHNLLGETYNVLLAIKPTYLGFISSQAGLPIELAGNPPLATQFAIGHLSGPDLVTTCILVTRAALNENVVRPAVIKAVLCESGDAIATSVLPGAQAEITIVSTTLAAGTDVDLEIVGREHDLDEFLDRLSSAHLAHFAGHGSYDDERPEQSGLIFRQSKLTPSRLTNNLQGMPMIFSNACETGRLSNIKQAKGGQGRESIAASFIAKGAVNYLGSLWPIFDESSRNLAEDFYRQLCNGLPVGEALRLARLRVHTDNDPTWAAYILFGCPRNRLRARVQDVKNKGAT